MIQKTENFRLPIFIHLINFLYSYFLKLDTRHQILQNLEDYGIIWNQEEKIDALEDIGLSRAIEEGDKSQTVSRDEIFKVLIEKPFDFKLTLIQLF